MADLRPLESTVREFATLHGVHAFLQTYYELVGAGPSARITSDNLSVAAALGLPVPSALPTTFPRSTLWNAAPTATRRLRDRERLSRLFADPDRWPELTGTQRLYLAWVFSCPDDFSRNLMLTPRSGALGWFSALTLDGPGDLDVTTFSVVGCTIVFAVAADGSIHASHFSTVPESASRQATLLCDFMARCDCRDLYILGFCARSFAESVTALHPTTTVHLHPKADGGRTSYHAVRLRRLAGHVFINHCCGPFTSTVDGANPFLNGPCKDLWAYWDTSAVFPLPDKEFVPTPFTRLLPWSAK